MLGCVSKSVSSPPRFPDYDDIVLAASQPFPDYDIVLATRDPLTLGCLGSIVLALDRLGVIFVPRGRPWVSRVLGAARPGP